MNATSGDVDKKPMFSNLCGEAFQQDSALVDRSGETPSAASGDVDKKPVFSNLCGEVFQQDSALVDHQRAHSGKPADQPYGDSKLVFRSYCGEAFQQEMLSEGDADLNSHVDNTQCAFQEELALKDQKKVHSTSQTKVYTTGNICHAAFPEDSTLEDHQRPHVDEHAYLAEETDSQNGESQQTARGRSFAQDVDDEEDKPYDYFPRLISATRQKNEAKVQQICTEENIYSCHICNTSYPTKGRLNAHVMWHTPKRKFPCLTCGKVYPQQSYLIAHERTHSKEKPFICECGKAFACHQGLKYHRTRKHSASCVCACGKGFSQRSSLESHQNECSASNKRKDKPFLCDCGLCFASFKGLKQHQTRKHSASCVCVCGEGFSQINSLGSHQKVCPASSKRKKEPFVCDCGITFAGLKGLQHHQATKHSALCVCVCSLGFSQRSNLESHQKECSVFNERKELKVEKESQNDGTKMRVFIGTKYGSILEV